MIRDEVENILKEKGWVKSISAPEEMIDWQRSNPYSRLMIYPDDLKFVTKEVLDKLMSETDISAHGEILNKAEEDYYKTQSRFEVTPEKEITLETEERKMRDELKKLIDDVPVEYLSDLLMKIKEFWVEKKTRPEKTVPVKRWTEREYKEPTPVTEEGARVAVIELANKDAADIAEKAFIALAEDKKVYKSAVVLNGTTVRTVELEKDTKGTTVVMFNAASNESALGMRILFDGTLSKELRVIRVTRAETKLSVSYIVTGIKIKLKKKEKVRDTGSAFEENGTLNFLKKRRGD